MKARHYSTEPIKDNPHGVEVCQMYNDASAQMMHMTLQPGQSLKPHKTPVDVTFYVLEGQPTIHIGDEVQAFGPDTLIESPAFIVHHISNDTDKPARVLVTKAPRPEQATKVL